MGDKINPIRETDGDARALAQGLLKTARFASLGVIDPETASPMVTRIALVCAADGAPMSLISDLSLHSTALTANPTCSLLVGEVEAKGDPLTHPRLTLQAHATAADKQALKAHYLSAYPKAKLYYDFGDFRLIRFELSHAFLNGGFGKAYHLTPSDLIG